MATKLKVITIKTLAAFASQVEDLLNNATEKSSENPFEGHWYRGVGNATYSLTPSLFRHPTFTAVEDFIKLEAKMLEDFQRHKVLHTEDMSGSSQEQDLRTLFYMQHYGIPTRLLDWTTNPFIALYFALSTAATNNLGQAVEDAAVWVLNPVGWNKVSLSQISHGNSGPLRYSDAVENYAPRKLYAGSLEPTAIKTLYDLPACILGISNNARMFAQRGVFTVFGRSLHPMEKQFGTGSFAQESLTKLVFPKTVIGPLLNLLLRLGYTDSVSYPDLHGLSMEIKRARGFKV
ncbi:FRG domain-containing protein [Polaromonas sp. YR568]|uniref:FRG domain-containing protein n=1 Tax=Polaromonas sp. YR568 TaxID=1855301 RepID=UPI00398BBF04